MSKDGGFPEVRGRRLRRTAGLRSMVRETRIAPQQLILPLFACPGERIRDPVPSMPGVDRTSKDELLRDAERAAAAGVGGVLLFGLPETKDDLGSQAWAEDGVVQDAVRLLKRELPDLVVATDVCLCEYTSHGHCGVLEGETVLNDPTLELLSRTAVSLAAAGADLIAPSDMMDGRVAVIRGALDNSGASDIPIMSYAAKFASAFYGPFRDAADSAPTAGDRRGYQMDSANGDEAVREARQDVAEGADIVMVKPALPYLDIVRRVSEAVPVPVAAYHVSGEYAAVVAAAERGWLDGPRVMEESLVSIARAGATVLISYWATEFAIRQGTSL